MKEKEENSMDAGREFKYYDLKNNNTCIGVVFSTKVMHFREIRAPICVQIRQNKRKSIIKEYGHHVYFSRILIRSQYGRWKEKDYSKYLFNTPQAAMNFLEKTLYRDRSEINNFYCKGI